MSSIRSSVSSRVVVAGYALVAVGAGVAFVNFLTAQYPYSGWTQFYVTMVNLAPALVALAAFGTWMFIGGLLEHAAPGRARWGICGFSLQAFCLALVSAAELSYFVATPNDYFIGNWLYLAQSLLLFGGLVSTVGFIVMAIRVGHVGDESAEVGTADDPSDDGTSDELADDDASVDETPSYVPTLPT
jgi:hypothetical protein